MPDPLVSVVIAAHDRAEELARTLQDLQRQSYGALEMIVIDDASTTPLEATVRSGWPEAVFWRNGSNLGAHVTRSLGMRRAKGQFILTLDDDSSPIESDAIEIAVRRFALEPELGVVAFYVQESRSVPPAPRPVIEERYVHEFVNCGQMMRREVASDVGDYRAFFQCYAEEPDYALRVLDHGWRIKLLPQIGVQHRKSPIGRRRGRIFGYNWRNSLWTIVLDYPFPRVVASLCWKIAGGLLEMTRLREWRWGAWSLWSFVAELPRVMRLRRPVSRATMTRLDLLRYRWVRRPEELEEARGPSLAERWRWYRTVWRSRQRFRSPADGNEGELGTFIYYTPPPPR